MIRQIGINNTTLESIVAIDEKLWKDMTAAAIALGSLDKEKSYKTEEFWAAFASLMRILAERLPSPGWAGGSGRVSWDVVTTTTYKVNMKTGVNEGCQGEILERSRRGE